MKILVERELNMLQYMHVRMYVVVGTCDITAGVPPDDLNPAE